MSIPTLIWRRTVGASSALWRAYASNEAYACSLLLGFGLLAILLSWSVLIG